MANLKFICNRAHHATYRKTVKVIVYENQNTKNNRRYLRSDLGFDMQLRPVSKRRRSPRLIHEGNHCAKHHQEKQNTHIPRVRHLFDHSVLEHCIQKAGETPLTNEKPTDKDADKQRRISFFGNERQDDSHDGGD